VGRDGCGWSGKESYSVEVPTQRRASKQCERHKSVAPVQEGTARCATVRDAGSCCSNAEVREREHLSAAEGASTSVGVSSPTGRSDWEISYLLLSN